MDNLPVRTRGMVIRRFLRWRPVSALCTPAQKSPLGVPSARSCTSEARRGFWLRTIDRTRTSGAEDGMEDLGDLTLLGVDIGTAHVKRALTTKTAASSGLPTVALPPDGSGGRSRVRSPRGRAHRLGGYPAGRGAVWAAAGDRGSQHGRVWFLGRRLRRTARPGGRLVRRAHGASGRALEGAPGPLGALLPCRASPRAAVLGLQARVAPGEHAGGLVEGRCLARHGRVSGLSHDRREEDRPVAVQPYDVVQYRTRGVGREAVRPRG